MITRETRDNIVKREEILRKYCIEQGFTKKNGWTSYKPEEVAHLNPPTNDERSAVEIFDFVNNPPDKYFLYINDKEKKATTWTGERLGYVTFLNSNKNPKIVIEAINGKTYKGIYYKEDGDYARVKRC